MQVVPVPVSEAIISTVAQMFVLAALVVLYLVRLVLVEGLRLMLKPVLELLRPSGRLPLHSNTSRPHHS